MKKQNDLLPDEEWETLLDDVYVLLQDSGLDNIDCLRAVEIGIYILISAKKDLTKEIINRRQEEKCDRCIFVLPTKGKGIKDEL